MQEVNLQSGGSRVIIASVEPVIRALNRDSLSFNASMFRLFFRAIVASELSTYATRLSSSVKAP
ncbi:MAG TPA: hypothetical protein PK745_18845, partial [bacterium]|nr:hypothetical protein [bacterium]